MKTKKPARGSTKSKAARHKAKIRAQRPVHKKLLLHPASVFILLCVGVLLMLWTWKTFADSYNVTAKIPAPPLTEPATITIPSDGAKFSTKPITVSGSCPDNSYVKLFRNDVFSGVAVCSTQSFSIQTDLSVGTNKLTAQDYNITDDAGPAGNTITVSYNPPVSSTPSSKPQYQPLVLSADYLYKGYAPGDNFSWQVSISGGKSPYAAHVDWGDRQGDNLVLTNAGQFDISHAYSDAGIYTVIISASDAAGNKTSLQLVAVVRQLGAAIGSTKSTTPPATSSQSNKTWLWYLWPSYLILLLMVISFWLGEKEKYYELMRAQRRINRHA